MPQASAARPPTGKGHHCATVLSTAGRTCSPQPPATAQPCLPASPPAAGAPRRRCPPAPRPAAAPPRPPIAAGAPAPQSQRPGSPAACATYSGRVVERQGELSTHRGTAQAVRSIEAAARRRRSRVQARSCHVVECAAGMVACWRGNSRRLSQCTKAAALPCASASHAAAMAGMRSRPKLLGHRCHLVPQLRAPLPALCRRAASLGHAPLQLP
jgi:hypothetical protein